MSISSLLFVFCLFELVAMFVHIEAGSTVGPIPGPATAPPPPPAPTGALPIDAESTVVPITECDLHCDPSSGCSTHGYLTCDTLCYAEFFLETNNYTCQPVCHPECATTCNEYGPGTCDGVCNSGFTFDLVDFMCHGAPQVNTESTVVPITELYVSSTTTLATIGIADTNYAVPAVTQPSGRGPYPQLTGSGVPTLSVQTIPATYSGRAYNDFKFVITVPYSTTVDDGARFDVMLMVDYSTFSTKTTDPTNLDVVFTSSEVSSLLGRTLMCAVNTYWQDQPGSQSGYIYNWAQLYYGIQFSADTYYYTWHYWWWSFSYIMFAESVRYVTLSYELSVPVPCPPCTVTYTVVYQEGLLLSSCSLTFSSDDPLGTVKKIRIRAVQASGSYWRWLWIQYSQPTTEIAGTNWDSFQLDPLYVLIGDWYASRSCTSTGDPHIYNFDYGYLSVYFAADFILWRRYGTSFLDIQVRTWQCYPWLTCDCAIAVREDNNVLGLNGCGSDGVIVPINYLNDGTGASMQISYDGYLYQIMMPSGTYVTVWAWCWQAWSWFDYHQPGGCMMHINVIPSSDPGATSEGLCGNYNGDSSDDLIPKGGTTPDPNYWEPNIFAASYTVLPEESLINGHRFIPGCRQVNITDETLPLPSFCDCVNPLSSCTPAVAAGTSQMRTATMFSTQGTDSCTTTLVRRKRQTTGSTAPSGDGNIIGPDDLPIPVPDTPPTAPLHPETPSWPTLHSGITEAQAHDECMGPILASPIYPKCVGFTQEKLDAIIKGCVDDIQLSEDIHGSTMGILQRFKEACILSVQQADNRTEDEAMQARNESLAMNETISRNDTVSPLTQAIFNSIAADLCPGQPECSGNGTCSEAKCECYPGFIGVDCSVNLANPPVINGIRNGFACDVTKRPCSRASLFATGFAYTTSFACRVTLNGEVFYTESSLVSAGEVQCLLPFSPADPRFTLSFYLWSVAVSNDNVTFSTDAQLLVYDSTCMNCTTAAVSECLPQVDTCLIDSKCYVIGETNLTDVCLKCDPTISSTTWTPVTDTLPCLTVDHCLIGSTSYRLIGDRWSAGGCKTVQCVACSQCSTGGQLRATSWCNSMEKCVNGKCKLSSSNKKKCRKVLTKHFARIIRNGCSKSSVRKKYPGRCKLYKFSKICKKYRSQLGG